jgi:hypothetical protein
LVTVTQPTTILTARLVAPTGAKEKKGRCLHPVQQRMAAAAAVR